VTTAFARPEVTGHLVRVAGAMQSRRFGHPSAAVPTRVTRMLLLVAALRRRAAIGRLPKVASPRGFEPLLPP
jgi:hypothetical protein